MTLNEMNDAYQKNFIRIVEIEERIETETKPYLVEILKEQVESLKTLNRAISDAAWALYDAVF